ncbi:type I-E CRISPR-associated protein Cse1/CasA [Verticiella alkaliphila]|uniref:type I-E CRISPR-associated protein Cse1/CasA n=1 Tax=Verticiella alkaliphila TaxID=2779529 RepID=UPI00209A9EB9|nr:type I-E CRISPR-associated protein Cse1/CasA [Verticiella sp. GG226]
MCEACVAQALFTLQINAPSGGRGIRTSLRGGGPMTTLLLPQQEDATLWQRLWANVLTSDTLGHDPVTAWGAVLPWMAPTRTSDGPGALDTTPDTVHPLQAYWSMPRRIRLDSATITQGDCAVCDSQGVKLFQHYRTRYGGTNYTGAWMHPLTPYSLDPKHESPPLSIKGQPGGIGYRHWLGLTFGKPDQQPQAAQVIKHYRATLKAGPARLWCFGYDMNNMKARCWYDSTLPVHVVDEADQRLFIEQVSDWTKVASEAASALHYRVKSAWFKRPGDTGSEPAIHQSFWQGTEPAFYAGVQALAGSDVRDPAECAALSRQWLSHVSRAAMNLFEHWTLSGPVEERDLARVVRARAALAKDLKAGKAAKTLWSSISPHLTEKA